MTSGAAGADGPYGLIGDDQRSECLRVDTFEGNRDLKVEDIGGEVLLALVQMLAHADDRHQGMSKSRLQLEIDGGVGLVEVLAALRVPDQHVRRSYGGHHDGRGLAGIGSVVEPVHILSADEDGLVASGIHNGRKAWHRREESDFDGCVVLDERKKLGKEGRGFGRSLIHLPVCGDQEFAHDESQVPR